MPARQPTVDDLRAQLEDLRTRFRGFSDDQLFVLWFFQAYLVGDDGIAERAVTGGPSDRGVDGVFVDEHAKGVFIVQGKLRDRVNGKAESRSDVTSFAHLAAPLLGTQDEFESF